MLRGLFQMRRKKKLVHEWGPWEEEGAAGWACRYCLHCGESDLARIPLICEVR